MTTPTNRFGVSLNDLQSLRDDMDKYRTQLTSSGTLWKEAFRLQELENEIELMEKSINKAFDFVIQNANTSNPRIYSQLKKNQQEFKSLVHRGRINVDDFF